MPKVKVLLPFVDKETGDRRSPGDEFDVKAARANDLAAKGFVEKLESAPAPKAK
ncbi:MAG: hypothetical protein K6T83_10780 [Alicyclobacillus sp.]|nr:hypothetical protein [Alicyclobacillus sp.]